MSAGFFSKVGLSTSPTGYRDLMGEGMISGIHYLVWLGVLCLIIKTVFFLPTAIGIVNSIESATQKFEKASFSGVFATKEPVLIPQSNPYVQIDTSAQPKKSAEVLITQSGIVVGEGTEERRIPFPDFSNSNIAPESMRIVQWIVLFLIISLLFAIYLASLFKAALFALVIGSLGYIYCSARKSRISYSSVMGLALFSTTSMLLIEALIVPLRFSDYLFPLVSFFGVTLLLIPATIALCMFLIWIALATSGKYDYE